MGVIRVAQALPSSACSGLVSGQRRRVRGPMIGSSPKPLASAQGISIAVLASHSAHCALVASCGGTHARRSLKGYKRKLRTANHRTPPRRRRDLRCALLRPQPSPPPPPLLFSPGPPRPPARTTPTHVASSTHLSARFSLSFLSSPSLLSVCRPGSSAHSHSHSSLFSALLLPSFSFLLCPALAVDVSDPSVAIVFVASLSSSSPS